MRRSRTYPLPSNFWFNWLEVEVQASPQSYNSTHTRLFTTAQSVIAKIGDNPNVYLEKIHQINSGPTSTLNTRHLQEGMRKSLHQYWKISGIYRTHTHTHKAMGRTVFIGSYCLHKKKKRKSYIFILLVLAYSNSGRVHGVTKWGPKVAWVTVFGDMGGTGAL